MKFYVTNNFNELPSSWDQLEEYNNWSPDNQSPSQPKSFKVLGDSEANSTHCPTITIEYKSCRAEQDPVSAFPKYEFCFLCTKDDKTLEVVIPLILFKNDLIGSSHANILEMIASRLSKAFGSGLGVDWRRFREPLICLLSANLDVPKIYTHVTHENMYGPKLPKPYSFIAKEMAPEVAPPVVSKLGIPDLNKQLLSPCGDLCEETSGFDYKRPLTEIIIHLNDRHKWSREKIADWLDEIHDKGLVDLTMKEK